MNEQNRNKFMKMFRWLADKREVGEKGEEIEKYKLAVTKSSWGVKCGIRNIVNDIITTCGVRWVLDLLG